jgi:hypothetical protein
VKIQPSEEFQYIKYDSSYKISCTAKTAKIQNIEPAIHTSLYKNRVRPLKFNLDFNYEIIKLKL